MAGGGYDLEEIRRRADIVEIISPHVALRKAGRRLVGLCPFHQEKTGSFTVDPETGLWHCFGCKAGGDLFRFVEMIEKVTVAEAAELLARRLGVAPRRPAEAARQRGRERLLALHEAASRFFQAQLRARMGEHARAYLAGRGVAPASIEGFALGYAPASWDALLNAMQGRGFSGQELAQAGLVIPREADASRQVTGGFYDRFRDRVIFPIRDGSGRVIAFGGRALGEDQQPKYINSPDSPLFQKGRVLYALDHARHAMADTGRALVVEGYLDVIACHEAGLAETVATMGTALTPDHVDLFRRRLSEGRGAEASAVGGPGLILAFDADSAGLAAALRSRDLFQQAGLSVRVVTLPEGLDPDRVLRERGAEALRDLVSAALPMVEWELTRILRRREGRSETDRLVGLREAVATLGRMPEGVEREYYTRWLAEHWESGSPSRTALTETAIREELTRLLARRGDRSRRMGGPVPAEAPTARQVPEKPSASLGKANLLGALITHGELARRYVAELKPDDFSGGQRAVFTALQRLVAEGEEVTVQSLVAAVEPTATQSLAEVLVGHVPEDRVAESLESGVARLVEDRLRRREAELRERLEQVDSQQAREGILRDLAEVGRERSRLAGHRLVGEN